MPDAESMPNTAVLKEALFEDCWAREFFIDEWILTDGPSHAMPWEQAEQRAELGAIQVCVEDVPFSSPRILSEALFIHEAELDSKRGRALEWAMATAARDICPLVISYRLTDDGSDFASLALVRLASFPEGACFTYDGTVYPMPFSRQIALTGSGRFELRRSCGQDEQGDFWFEVRSKDTGEVLYLTGALVLAAAYRAASPRTRSDM